MANNKVMLADGTVLMDVSGVSVTAATLAAGETAMGADGSIIVGEMDASGGGNTDIEDALITHTLAGDYVNDRVTEVGAYAFYKCTALTSVSFPEVTGDVGTNAFNGCTNLRSAEIPNAKWLGANCFNDCTSLESIELQVCNEEIAGRCFQGCESLKMAYLPMVDEIQTYAFSGCTSLESIVCPNVETLGTYAFNNCAALKAFDAPRVTAVPSYAFFGCTSLERISFVPTSISGTNAFRNCSSLKEISTLAKTHPAYTFSSCRRLQLAVLINAEGSNAIAANCFSQCDSLIALVLPVQATTTSGPYAYLAATSAFTGTPIASGTGYIYVPRASLSLYQSATNWSTYADQFRAIEDYTLDGTLGSELDLEKMGVVL